jgi:hypothetical protein
LLAAADADAAEFRLFMLNEVDEPLPRTFIPPLR